MDLDIKVKLIIVGLLIISLVAVYLIFSQKATQQTSSIVENQPIVQTTPVPTPSPTATTYRQPPQIVGKNSTANQNLPKTAFPSYFLGVFALSAAVSGFFLRKFPQ